MCVLIQNNTQDTVRETQTGTLRMLPLAFNWLGKKQDFFMITYLLNWGQYTVYSKTEIIQKLKGKNGLPTGCIQYHQNQPTVTVAGAKINQTRVSSRVSPGELPGGVRSQASPASQACVLGSWGFGGTVV